MSISGQGMGNEITDKAISESYNYLSTTHATQGAELALNIFQLMLFSFQMLQQQSRSLGRFDTLAASFAETARRNIEPGGVAATLLFARGVHAIMAHRVIHQLWNEGDLELSLALKARAIGPAKVSFL